MTPYFMTQLRTSLKVHFRGGSYDSGASLTMVLLFQDVLSGTQKRIKRASGHGGREKKNTTNN